MEKRIIKLQTRGYLSTGQLQTDQSWPRCLKVRDRQASCFLHQYHIEKAIFHIPWYKQAHIFPFSRCSSRCRKQCKENFFIVAIILIDFCNWIFCQQEIFPIFEKIIAQKIEITKGYWFRSPIKVESNGKDTLEIKVIFHLSVVEYKKKATYPCLFLHIKLLYST